MTAGRRAAARGLVGAALLCLATAVAVHMTGGFTLRLGALTVRSHEALRPLAIAALLMAAAFLVARRDGVLEALTAAPSALEWYASGTAVVMAACTVAAAIYWGAFVAGGSDSYCYLNQAELFARGAVQDVEPLSGDPTWPGTVWAFVPAGHMPRGSPPPALVPICPPGYPLLMAGARLVGGRQAMFLVTPLMGGVAVYLSFLLARRLAGGAAGLLAALLSGLSPTFLYQLFQPMNDVTAAACWLAVIVLAAGVRPGGLRRAAFAGLATAAALLVRPNLVPLAAIAAAGVVALPRGANLRERVRLTAAFGAGAAAGPFGVMLLQHALYGSPLRSGYGDLDKLFAWQHVMPNVHRYAVWLLGSHTPVILLALLAPWLLWQASHGPRADQRRVGQHRGAQAAWILCFAAVTLGCYLPYVVFDAWWYTRFLLPGILPMLALAASVIVIAIGRLPRPAQAPAATLLVTVLSVTLLQIATRRDVFRLQSLEGRFRAVGEYAATLPPNAAFITLHHSGSLRFYTGRATVGWADIDQGRLHDAITFLRRNGREPYLVLEDWEEPQFRERFAGERLGALDWPPLTRIDRVRLYAVNPATRETPRASQPPGDGTSQRGTR